MLRTRSDGATALRSVSAACSRRATGSEPAPAIRISSKERDGGCHPPNLFEGYLGGFALVDGGCLEAFDLVD
jgi:hypothetical protein